MAHAVSLSYARSDHMSPLAVAMTTTLHVAVAAALYWISPLNQIDTTPDPIAITMEREIEPPTPEPAQPAPTPSPSPSPAPQAAAPSPQPPAAPPARLGLAPIAPNPSTDPKATAGVEKPAPPKPETPSAEAAQPEPPKPEQQQALATPPPPPPPPPPEPKLENALPPVEAPPTPLTSQEIPRPVPMPVPPPPAPKPPPPPQQRAQPAPPPPPQPRQQQALQTSPLANVPTPREQQASHQAPAFTNPADMYGTRRSEERYVWYIAQKVSQHQQFVSNTMTEAGSLVLRITIARDGRLMEVGLSRSSGSPSLDNVSMNMVRQAGPYMPLPDDIAGAQHTFILPLNFRRN